MKFNLTKATTPTYIALRFDADANRHIKAIQQRVRATYNQTGSINSPHMTLTDYAEPFHTLRPKLERLAKIIQPMSFKFWRVGSFVQSGTVYIAPQNDFPFKVLKTKTITHLGPATSKYFGLDWTPHCTITKALKKSTLPNAEVLVATDFDVFEATAVGFQTFNRVEDNYFIRFGD